MHRIQTALPRHELKDFVRVFAQRDISGVGNGFRQSDIASLEQILAFAGNRGISMVGFSPRRLEDVAPGGRQRGARRQHLAMLVCDVDAPRTGDYTIKVRATAVKDTVQ